jgi:hypothetical protein
MLYRIQWLDGSTEILEADSISAARKEAGSLYAGKIKKVCALYESDDDVAANPDENDEFESNPDEDDHDLSENPDLDDDDD